MITHAVLAQSAFAQVYSRLTLAACQKQVMFFADVAPVCFGIQFSRLTESKLDVAWTLIEATMISDQKAGRKPLAALILTRSAGRYAPSAKFFQSYEKLFGVKLSDSEWERLVAEIFLDYDSESFNGHGIDEALKMVKEMRA